MGQLETISDFERLTVMNKLNIGIQLFMCIYGLTVFLETPSSLRKGRLPYILLSFLLFVLLSISSTLNVNFLFRILFNATSPENFIFLRERTSDSLTFTSETLNLVVIFLGDGLLVCHRLLLLSLAAPLNKR